MGSNEARRKPIPAPIPRGRDVGLARAVEPARGRSVLPSVAALLAATAALACQREAVQPQADPVVVVVKHGEPLAPPKPALANHDVPEGMPKPYEALPPIPTVTTATVKTPPTPPPIAPPTHHPLVKGGPAIVHPPKHPPPVAGGLKPSSPSPKTPRIEVF